MPVTPTTSATSAPTGRPHPALRRLVAAYVGYHHVFDSPVVHHGLPSCSTTVVLAFDEPLDVAWHGDPASRTRLWTSASGMHLAPAVIDAGTRQHGIQLALTPAGVRTLLGVPMAALASELADHADLPLGLDPATHARIADAPTWERRFELLDEHLLSRAHGPTRVTGVRADVAEAWRLVRASSGRIRTGELADRVGWSERHLRTLFTAEFGVTPKQACRVARFERARRLAGEGAPLAAVAAEAGYADQAHLSREWRALAGLTPTETLADPFRIVQDQTGTLAGSSAA